jgi:FtsZ-binding cell division protein ZapB
MDGTLITNSDTAQLFHDMLAKKEDTNLIRNQMQIVKEKHTWQKRVSDLLSLV